MKSFLRTIASAAVLCTSASASDISWSCASNSVNYTSEGAPEVLGSGFVFELGGFIDGFEPTAINVDQWANKWVALDRAEYNPVSKFFSSKASVVSNAPPFSWGGQGYMWGFDQASPGEWILLKNPVWLWPGAGGGPQPPSTWGVSNANTVAVVGAVNGSGFQMTTEQIFEEPPDVDPSAWQQQFFNAAERINPEISGWDADPDNDGANNLTELAAGTHPKTASETPVVGIGLVDGGSGSLELEISLQRGHRANITHGASVSADLGDWSSIGMSVESDTLSELVLRFPSNVPTQFIRFTFEL